MAGRGVGNALIRSRRQARFVVADRYRALLGGRHPSLAAAAASTLDAGATLAARARNARRRDDTTGGATLVAVTITGDRHTPELSIVVRNAPGARLYARRGDHVEPLPTTVHASDPSVLRAHAALPDAITDGAAWSIAIGDDAAQWPVAAGRARPRPPFGTAADGTLTLTLAKPTGIAHTVEIGVRSAVITWPTAAGTELTFAPADGSEPVTFAGTVRDDTATAVVDLAQLADRDTEWSARVDAQPLTRVFPSPAGGSVRVPTRWRGAEVGSLEIGYDADNRLTVWAR